ncbi:YxcD family protein [Fodinisporobacter ferrooxydans]|uniref:YxcD family protein n=1 Tax=Fodinisporobacter ferrooxydans TaxID=2901836 RepID=A0ABY4CE92_9BACL|nr:YxcD family protein [Alicyclobacillaceae bacterium MYW30-H2]
MKIFFDEQDVIDSACVMLANRYRMRPEDFDVNLRFNREEGFSANAIHQGGWRSGDQQYYLSEQDLIDGIAVYLADFHQFNPQRLEIDLSFSERDGFGATILSGMR